MMQNRLLNALNVILILVCIGCIWYLATAQYNEPAEIAGGEIVSPITKTETSHQGRPNPPSIPAAATRPVATPDARLNKNPFYPLYTPTPTPTPAPTPTPPPADLNNATFGWQVRELGENKATFEDTRTQESFELTVGGPGRKAMDATGRALEVTLIAVDLGTLKATIGAAGVTKEIAY